MSKPQATDLFWLTWCDEELRQGRTVQIRAHGLSMFPQIWPGAMLSIFRKDVRSLKVDDWILFRRKDHFVAHRLIEVLHQKELIGYAQGDANFFRDEPITIDNYVGVVEAINGRKKSMRRINKWFRLGFSILVWSYRQPRRIMSKLKQFFKSAKPRF
ncbi:MAG: hypothetical protein NWS92_07780 [Crocinitomicaceae bacterium]|jgi:hypothetical protein|nr:hypothetical protein [Crocinitomicaceae bacterium]